MPEINLNREIFGWLIATKMGHSHFAEYHKTFEYEKMEFCCRYGQKRLQLYFFSYLHIKLHRAKLFSLVKKRPFIFNKILETVKEVKVFAKWALKTELF